MNLTPEPQYLAPEISIFEMLEHLARLQPDLVQLKPARNKSKVWCFHHPIRFRFSHHCPLMARDSAFLQATVQSWIQSQGWYWEVTHHRQSEYIVVVWVPFDSGLAPVGLSHCTLVGALLGAFVKTVRLHQTQGWLKP